MQRLLHYLFFCLLLTVPLTSKGQDSKLPATDSCAAQIPADLNMEIVKRFKLYRLPKETDNLVEDIEYYKSNAGSGCLGVTIGDFDGDGVDDIALLLSAITGEKTLLVVVLRDGKKIRFDVLRTFTNDRQHLFLETIPAGQYDRTQSLVDSKKELGEIESIRSEREGILTGSTESTGVAYFLNLSKWQHVWISD